MPPLPRAVPAPPASALERGVDLDDLLDERRVFVLLRIGGEEPGGVGEHHERVRVEQVGDERGEEVVVAVADLVVGDRVVLVHDREHAEVEQALQRLAGVQVLAAVHEVVRREQHLAADDVVRREDRVQPLDEARLADRGERLQRADVGGPRREPERGHAGRDRAGEHEHDAVPRGVRGREVAAQLQDRGVVEITALVGDRRRPDLHDREHAPRSHSFFVRELERTDAHEITVVDTRPRERALDAHAAQPLLYVRHRFVVREVGERDRALGRPAGDAPRPLAFAHDVEALLLGTQHDVGSDSPSFARASSTSFAISPSSSSTPARVTAEIVSPANDSVATSALVPTTTRGRSSSCGW